MKKKGKQRKCPFCQISFISDPRNQHDQRYCCGSDECKRESHRAASAKYRQQHRDDKTHKRNECERVKKWQRDHPDYWKAKKNGKIISTDVLLRDMTQAPIAARPR